jgi:hypothetical protein
MTEEKPSPFIDEYLGRYLLQGALKEEGEVRAKQLGSRNRIVDEVYVPQYPRYLWLGARLDFVLMNDVACIITCAATIEASLKDFLGVYFRKQLQLDFDTALDEMELRSLLAMCYSLSLFKESDAIVTHIHTVEQIRHEFVHSKIHKLIEKSRTRFAKELGSEWNEIDAKVQELMVAGGVGEDESLKTLELLEKILKGLFQDSQYAKW